jgi:hypothetical protein
MKSAQFYKGMIKGTEEQYESPDLLQILPHDKLAVLWDKDKIGIYPYVFLSERVIAKTVVTKAEPDEHGRDGIINHTVIYRWDNKTTFEGAPYLFDTEQFLKDVKAGKYNITMPSPPELKKPLDAPPILEVQQ